MQNLGIVGIGYWGGKLISEFSEIANIKFCYSQGNKNNVKWIKKNHPTIKICKNFQEILDDTSINAIIIASPIKTHFEYASKSLKSKKHVFIEKPISTSTKQGKILLELAKKNNLEIFVGHIFLYHPVLKKLKKILEKQVIDSIYLGWNKFGSFNEKISLDLLSHYIIILEELVNIPKKIIIQNKIGCVTECDIISLKIKFEKKISCIIEINRISAYKKREIIIKTTSNLYKWDDDILLKFSIKDRMFKEYYSSKETPLKIECNEFIRNLSLKNKKYYNAEKSISNISIIENL